MALTAAVELPSFLGQFRAEIFTAPAAFSASLLAIAAYLTLLLVGSLTAALLTFQVRMLFRGETTLEVLRRGSSLGEDEAAVLGEFPEASWAHFQEVMGEDPAHWALPWLNPRTAIEEEEEEQQPAIELHEFPPLKFTPASKR